MCRRDGTQLNEGGDIGISLVVADTRTRFPGLPYLPTRARIKAKATVVGGPFQFVELIFHQAGSEVNMKKLGIPVRVVGLLCALVAGLACASPAVASPSGISPKADSATTAALPQRF